MMKHKITLFIFVAVLFFVDSSAIIATSDSVSESRVILERQLADIERQISEYEEELKNIKGEKRNVTSAIHRLRHEQEKLALQIEATNIRVKALEDGMARKESEIIRTEDEIKRKKRAMASVIRKLYKKGETPWLEIVVVNESISGFFSDMITLENLLLRLKELSSESKFLKEELKAQYQEFEKQKSDAVNLLNVKALQEDSLKDKIGAQNNILNVTKQKEAEYRLSIENTKKRAEEIRGRIYELLLGGVGRQVTFGEAVDIAQWVSARTGVRAALLLAVLTQESNLGKNVGTCNRPGDPPSKSWKNIMKPSRDQKPFLLITKELGLDPDTTPVSCPMRDSKGNRIGWGGAMGPAQFIPSTWIAYKGKISAFTGKKANPWDIRDAFAAAALLLKDNGATRSGSDSEWKAAMRYFSGSVNTRFRFYGDRVMELANKYQDDIDALSK